jgi:thioredoxin reductase
MAYKDYPFPEDVPLFPTHQQILAYIENYSKDVEQYVTFNEEVISVQYIKETSKWEVISRSTIDEAETTDFFDAVAIAVGSYDKPFIPNVSGLKEWHEKFPNSIVHAKSYDEPEQFKNSVNILVVGNSASGIDISYQLATKLNKVVYKSIRSEGKLPGGRDDRVKDVGDLLKFDPITKSVYFKDGFRLDNVDSIIFATGYLKSIPFVKGEELITDGAKVHGLYKHLIYYPNPTLAVIGVPRFVLPTRLSETQGCWLARVWSGRIQLPSQEEMEKFNASLEGDERKHHDLMFPKDVDYSNELNDQTHKAEGDYGYYAVTWDERQKQIRGSIVAIKLGYIKYMADHNKPAASLEVLEDLEYFEYPDEIEKTE